MNDREKYMTTKQVSALLHVSERALIKWREVGKGPEWIKSPAGHVYYEREIVENWMKGGKTDGIK